MSEIVSEDSKQLQNMNTAKDVSSDVSSVTWMGSGWGDGKDTEILEKIILAYTAGDVTLLGALEDVPLDSGHHKD